LVVSIDLSKVAILEKKRSSHVCGFEELFNPRKNKKRRERSC